MNQKKYKKLAQNVFPDKNFDKVPDPMPELLKMVAIELYLSKATTNQRWYDLDKETKYQLRYLREHGITDFLK